MGRLRPRQPTLQPCGGEPKITRNHWAYHPNPEAPSRKADIAVAQLCGKPVVVKPPMKAVTLTLTPTTPELFKAYCITYVDRIDAIRTLQDRIVGVGASVTLQDY